MSYRGYKSYRAFLNAKLHAISIKLCGDRFVLDDEIAGILRARPLPVLPPVISTELLTDAEASRLYKRLLTTLASVGSRLQEAKRIAGDTSSMILTPAQRKAIIKLTKYDFRWSPEATFSFILSALPERRKRLSPWEIQNSKLNKLYSTMSRADADKVIKRLDQIKKRNKHNSENSGQS